MSAHTFTAPCPAKCEHSGIYRFPPDKRRGPKQCGKCTGSGVVKLRGRPEKPCFACNGTGRLNPAYKPRCSKCSNRGYTDAANAWPSFAVYGSTVNRAESELIDAIDLKQGLSDNDEIRELEIQGLHETGALDRHPSYAEMQRRAYAAKQDVKALRLDYADRYVSEPLSAESERELRTLRRSLGAEPTSDREIGDSKHDPLKASLAPFIRGVVEEYGDLLADLATNDLTAKAG